jgi:hypothetical protein
VYVVSPGGEGEAVRSCLICGEQITYTPDRFTWAHAGKVDDDHAPYPSDSTPPKKNKTSRKTRRTLKSR